ncbi:hypothetical protein EG329_014073 [Mollisiaceae sp. DMI_Dod_QoI]|nr:hypothetical protein EG329_014073 [Helotiales sp. DMI_Dod_QoI]
MKTARYATSRQKACQQCSNTKARCDRNQGGCARCTQRGLCCTYLGASSAGALARGLSVNNDPELCDPSSASNDVSVSDGLLPTPDNELLTGGDTHDRTIGSGRVMNTSTTTNNFRTTITRSYSPSGSYLNGITPMSEPMGVLDFSSLDLVCPINAGEISNRWLNAYIPTEGQTLKAYPISTTSFIYRILKSYAAVAVHGRGIPPFVHSSEIAALAACPPLSTCLSLVRICERPLPGSAGVATQVLEREMNNIYELRDTYDDMALLAAFQAYLLYAMVLFFRLSQGSNPFLRQAMMNLQELACISSQRGLVCVAEQQRARPRWESWIVAEAKRRTLYTMYLFDSVLSAQDGLPTFLGTELQGLPAPSNKALWESQSRHGWETAYNIYLAEWIDGGLCIHELWPIPADLDERGLSQIRSRVDEWLQNLDEFGTMLYAVTSCTHGS